jgi:hypothetical protein
VLLELISEQDAGIKTKMIPANNNNIFFNLIPLQILLFIGTYRCGAQSITEII